MSATPTPSHDTDFLEEPHVVAVDAPLKVFNPPDTRNPNNKIYYDSCNEELVIVQGNNIQFSPLYAHGKEVNCNNEVQEGQKVGKNPMRGAKRSFGKNYLAVLKSEREITFYKLKLPRCLPMTAYSCKQAFQLGKAVKRPNVVKDFFWLSDNVILILTSTAIETFTITSSSSSSSREGRTLQRLRHVATTIDFYSYHSKHKVLLCVNRDKPNCIKTYKIGSSSGINRYTKHKIDDSVAKEHHPDRCPVQHSFAGEKLPAYQFFITRLYGHTCFLHITIRQELVVYTLNTTLNSWEKTASLYLPDKAMYTLSIVDNLILVHNLNLRTTSIYDHKISTNSITASMPMGYGVQTTVPTGTGVACGVKGKEGINEWFYSDEVKPILPDKLLDLNGRIYGLMVNLRSVVPAFSQKQALLRFLLQRKGSKKDALTCIAKTITSSLPLSTVGSMFDTIIVAMSRGVRESMTASAQRSARSIAGGSTSPTHSNTNTWASSTSPGPPVAPGSPIANGSSFGGFEAPPTDPEIQEEPGVTICFTPPSDPVSVVYPFYSFSGDWYTSDHVLVIEQVDMLNDVFHKIHDTKPAPISAGRFSAVFLEYARSLSAHQIRLKDVLQRFMIDLLIYTDPPDYPKLHHYLQYHVIEDTVPTALQLLKFEDRYPPSFQLALDMLSRERAFPEIVEVLISRGLLVRAAEIMIQYKVRVKDLNHILSKASTCSDPLVLHSLCVLLKKYNQSVKDVRGFTEQDRCVAFEDQYASVLGVPVG
eukprot:TRINITY_DN2510_c1_g2_i1.p1 TRINITY_DN2510_c1_g2~~TRINITY_DN2510_c1_g2_i1.p1  ORF type:complete len:789 (+),score=138.31 TRINITY_DN2510_c1_g2_i1:90-2369(+)